MPEVCEIALLKEYLLRKLKGRRVTSIHSYTKKYKFPNYAKIEYTIKNIECKGKFLWMTLQQNDKILYIMAWFGLTGFFSFYKSKYDKMTIGIDDEYTLFFSDQLNYGNIIITDNINTLNKKLNSLAPDVLQTKFSDTEFASWIISYIMRYPNRKNMPILDLLMRQDDNDGIVSGIGNYLSAEILYHAKISPHRPINSLSKHELVTLAHSIKLIVMSAYLHNKTHYIDMITVKSHKKYHTDVIKQAKKFDFNVYQKTTDKFNNPVKRDKIIKGRTTYWVPAIQK